VADRRVAGTRPDRSLKATPRRWLIAFWVRKTSSPAQSAAARPNASALPQRAVPGLSPKHGELAQPRVDDGVNPSLAVSIACPIWDSSLAFV
jgi:hypothetical protein